MKLQTKSRLDTPLVNVRISFVGFQIFPLFKHYLGTKSTRDVSLCNTCNSSEFGSFILYKSQSMTMTI